VAGASAGYGAGQPVYTYSAGYDGVGNLLNYNDSVMGVWSFSYDTQNRLIANHRLLRDERHAAASCRSGCIPEGINAY
jgi:YD repeat-containing protein